MALRLRVHVLAYNLANFMRTLALPKEVEHWSLITIREKLVKIGAKVVAHGRYVTVQMTEVAVPRGYLPGHPSADPSTAMTCPGNGLKEQTSPGNVDYRLRSILQFIVPETGKRWRRLTGA